jgi:Flp pilus assembly protein TadD
MLSSVRPWALAIALALATPGAALAVEGAEEEAAALDPAYVAGRTAVRERRYTEAVRLLADALARNPADADVHNVLGYAHRKGGNLERAFHHYHEALRLNPRHRGAHEYIGEAYLMADDLAKAEHHLRALDWLCTSECDERDDLAKAIEAYKLRRRR